MFSVKHDVFGFSSGFHSVVKKVAQYMADVLEDSRDKVQENLLANGGRVMSQVQIQYQKSCKNIIF